MKYIPANNLLLIEKKETAGLVIAGQEDDAQAVLHGIVIEENENVKDSLIGTEIIFIRGQARKIKLNEKDFFLIDQEKVLMYGKKNS